MKSNHPKPTIAATTPAIALIVSMAIMGSFAASTAAHASEQDAARHRIGTSRSQGHTDRVGDQPVLPAVTKAQANVKASQELLGKIRKTSDPAERRALLQQHSLALRANLDEVRDLLKESDD